MTLSRSDAHRLAKKAAEMDARVLRGVLRVDSSEAKVDETDILEWLAQHAGTEIILIAVPIGRSSYSDEVKSCPTCGRDYTGDYCPHCREVRERLRGV